MSCSKAVILMWILAFRNQCPTLVFEVETFKIHISSEGHKNLMKYSNNYVLLSENIYEQFCQNNLIINLNEYFEIKQKNDVKRIWLLHFAVCRIFFWKKKLHKWSSCNAYSKGLKMFMFLHKCGRTNGPTITVLPRDSGSIAKKLHFQFLVCH